MTDYHLIHLPWCPGNVDYDAMNPPESPELELEIPKFSDCPECGKRFRLSGYDRELLLDCESQQDVDNELENVLLCRACEREASGA